MIRWRVPALQGCGPIGERHRTGERCARFFPPNPTGLEAECERPALPAHQRPDLQPGPSDAPGQITPGASWSCPSHRPFAPARHWSRSAKIAPAGHPFPHGSIGACHSGREPGPLRTLSALALRTVSPRQGLGWRHIFPRALRRSRPCATRVSLERPPQCPIPEKRNGLAHPCVRVRMRISL